MVFYRSLIIALLVILPLLTGSAEGFPNREVGKTESMKIFTTPNMDGSITENELNREGRLVGNDTDPKHPKIDDMLDTNNATAASNSASVKITTLPVTPGDDDGRDSTTTPASVATTTPVSTTPKNDVPASSTTIKSIVTTSTNPKSSSVTDAPKLNSSTSTDILLLDNSNTTTSPTTSTSPNSAAAQGLSMILFGLVGFFLI